MGPRSRRSPKAPVGEVDPTRAPGPRRREEALDREQVVSAAIGFIDEYGARRLTMARVGERLGVEAMSLYRYIPSREKLLDAIVETVMEELASDPQLPPSTPPQDWQDYLVRLAHGVRRIALAHPQVFPLVATRPPEAPWIRPPLRSLRWVESCLDMLLAQGFDDAGAVAAYRGYSSFLLGHLLLEVSALGADVGPLPAPDPDAAPGPGAVALQGFPHLQRLEGKLSQPHTKAEFDDSLESLLEHLALLRPAPGRSASKR